MVTIAVIAMGEMGAGLAARFVERGARVVTSLEGRSQASAARAQAAGVEVLKDAQIIDEADFFLSVVPPAYARDTAAQFLALADSRDRAPTFIDCNAIAPQTLHAIAQGFGDRGIPLIDGSIIGAAPKPGYSPRLFLSGPVGEAAAAIAALGVETRVLSATLGDASALKMAFGGFGKGFQALATAMALGAERAGVMDHLVAELADGQPELYPWLCKVLPDMYAKAYRWDGEMLEISKFLEPERGGADMLAGAALVYRQVAEDAQKSPDAGAVGVLKRFSQPAGEA